MRARMDQEPTWLPVFRALGINMAILADFHGDSHPTDTGKVRFDEQKVYFEGCQRFSDRDMLLIPGEEPDANFGGHYMFVFPKPLYFSHVKEPAKGPEGQPFEENLAPLRQGVSHDNGGDGVEAVESGTGAGVADASANEGVGGLSGCGAGERFLPKRPFPGRIVSIPAGGSYRRSGCARRGALGCWTT